MRSFLEPKSWRKYRIYWLLENSCFELFVDGKYGFCSSQEVYGKMIFTVYWEVLVLNFSVMGNMVFFSAKKVDGKMIFTWSFWAFYDIPGPGKYGFSRSVTYITFKFISTGLHVQLYWLALKKIIELRTKYLQKQFSKAWQT